MLLEKPHHPHHQEYQLYLIYYFSLPLLSNFVGMLPRVNFEAYNTKNEAILDEIIAPDYIDHGQSASATYGFAWKRSCWSVESTIYLFYSIIIYCTIKINTFLQNVILHLIYTILRHNT